VSAVSALDEQKDEFKALVKDALADTIKRFYSRTNQPDIRDRLATECEMFLRDLCRGNQSLLPNSHFVQVIPDELDRSRVEVQVSVPYSDELADRLWEAGVEFTVGGKPYTREYTFVVGEALVSPFPICENKKEK